MSLVSAPAQYQGRAKSLLGPTGKLPVHPGKPLQNMVDKRCCFQM